MVLAAKALHEPCGCMEQWTLGCAARGAPDRCSEALAAALCRGACWRPTGPAARSTDGWPAVGADGSAYGVGRQGAARALWMHGAVDSWLCCPGSAGSMFRGTGSSSLSRSVLATSLPLGAYCTSICSRHRRCESAGASSIISMNVCCPLLQMLSLNSCSFWSAPRYMQRMRRSWTRWQRRSLRAYLRKSQRENDCWSSFKDVSVWVSSGMQRVGKVSDPIGSSVQDTILSVYIRHRCTPAVHIPSGLFIEISSTQISPIYEASLRVSPCGSRVVAARQRRLHLAKPAGDAESRMRLPRPTMGVIEGILVHAKCMEH
jgi:hypothetical protein